MICGFLACEVVFNSRRRTDCVCVWIVCSRNPVMKVRPGKFAVKYCAEDKGWDELRHACADTGSRNPNRFLMQRGQQRLTSSRNI